MKKFILKISVWMLFPITTLFGQSLSYNGQLSAWNNFYDTGLKNSQLGFRYIPDLKASQSLGDNNSADAEISLNMYTDAEYNSMKSVKNNARVKPYRAFVRYSDSQFETRLGLQKINFGSAVLLRPLMWFDRVDPRDPLGITDGVYGLLDRYYFSNNANLWMWALYGNDTTKGLEQVKTKSGNPELGGRFQFPFPKSEVAASFHTRKIDQNDWEKIHKDKLASGRENRYALDGKFDFGIGLTFEGMVQQTIINETHTTWDKLLTIGADYTFNIGNGLDVLGEHLFSSIDSETALNLSYGIGLLDSVSTITYYSWNAKKFTYFLGWKRTYDNFVINISGFWSEKKPGTNFSGKGVQLLLSYNH